MKNVLFTLLFLIGMIEFSTGVAADPVDLTADTEFVVDTDSSVDVAVDTKIDLHSVHYSFKSVDLEDVGPAIINEPFRMPEAYWNIPEKAKASPNTVTYGFIDLDKPYI